MKKIVISNCWSFYNKGDAAITYGTLNIIKEKYPEAEITLLAFDHQSFTNKKDLEKYEIHPMPHLTQPMNMIDKLLNIFCFGAPNYSDYFGLIYIGIQIILLKAFRKINPQLNKVIEKIDQTDLFIAVGGNYLYSHVGLYNHLIPIIYAKLIKKKKVILYGHSIGPFKRNRLTQIYAYILKRSDKIVLRETISRDYLQNEMKIPYKNLTVLGDLAFNSYKNKEILKINENKKIAITVRPWLYDKPQLYNKYLKSIINIINHLINKYNYSIVLIPFSYAPGKEYDPKVCEYIHSKLSKEVKKKTSIMNIKEKTPSEIVNIFKENNFIIMIGTRLHSVILAALADIPSVIISYQHFKAEGISKQLGLNNYTIKIEDITPDELINLTEKLITNEKNNRIEIHNSIEKIRSKLIDNISF